MCRSMTCLASTDEALADEGCSRPAASRVKAKKGKSKGQGTLRFMERLLLSLLWNVVTHNHPLEVPYMHRTSSPCYSSIEKRSNEGKKYSTSTLHGRYLTDGVLFLHTRDWILPNG